MSDFYSRALDPGASGYFSTPSDHLDPNLFDGLHLNPVVRNWLLTMLVSGMERWLHVTGAAEWVHAWLAGSGVSYQWAADRGNGDLDILFGVRMDGFLQSNPIFTGLPEKYIADNANQLLKSKLWPQTDHAQFGSQTYEVTFFWSPGTGQSIERIHPYAAYDLNQDTWAVPPPKLPNDPRALYPDEWYEAAGRDVDAAETIARHHATVTRQLSSTLDDAGRRNANAELTGVQQSAMSLFDEIHGGRRDAFSEQGKGYGDWSNFRWQHAKQTGVIAALKGIVSQARQAQSDSMRKLYGGPIAGPEQIISRDIERYGRQP